MKKTENTNGLFNTLLAGALNKFPEQITIYTSTSNNPLGKWQLTVSHENELLDEFYYDSEEQMEHDADLLEELFNEVKEQKNIILLYFDHVDLATGNIIYKGSDNAYYASLEGRIHYMTGEGEPLSSVNPNLISVAEGEPVYDPQDRFSRRLLK